MLFQKMSHNFSGRVSWNLLDDPDSSSELLANIKQAVGKLKNFNFLYLKVKVNKKEFYFSWKLMLIKKSFTFHESKSFLKRVSFSRSQNFSFIKVLLQLQN